MNLVYPFIVADDEVKAWEPDAELAYAVLMAGSRRRKAGLIRTSAERVAALARVYYPFWLVPALPGECLVLDGLAFNAYKASFMEVKGIAGVVDDLARNETSFQTFFAALQRQVGSLTAHRVEEAYAAVVSDVEFLSYLSRGASKAQRVEDKDAVPLLPFAVDADAAVKTRDAVVNRLRRANADVRGLRFALDALDSAVSHMVQWLSGEAELLREKRQTELSGLKAQFDEKAKVLTRRHDDVVAKILKESERRISALSRRLDRHVKRVDKLEARKNAVLERLKKAERKRRKGGAGKAYGAYELQRLEREISAAKKDAEAVSELVDKLRKETEKRVKHEDEELRKALDAEADKLSEADETYAAKLKNLTKNVELMHAEAAKARRNIEGLISEIVRDADAFKHKAVVNIEADELRLICVPMYAAKYVDRDVSRCRMFPPMRLSEASGALKGLRRMLTFKPDSCLKQQPRVVCTKLEEAAARVEEKTQEDAKFASAVVSLVSAQDILRREGFAATVKSGFERLTGGGWVSAEDVGKALEAVAGDTS